MCIHVDTQTAYGLIIPWSPEHGSDQGPHRVQRGLYSWRALHPVPCEVANTVRGLCSVVNRIREDFTSLDNFIR